MILGGHNAVCSNLYIKQVRGFLKECKEGGLVISFCEDLFHSPPSIHHVGEGSRVFYSQWTRHSLFLFHSSIKVNR